MRAGESDWRGGKDGFLRAVPTGWSAPPPKPGNGLSRCQYRGRQRATIRNELG